jgi:hypothetical protein
MTTSYSPNNLVVGDIIKLADSDIIFEITKISYFSVELVNINKKDIRLSRAITTTDYYRTEPIKRWQEKLNEIGFEYLTNKIK